MGEKEDRFNQVKKKSKIIYEEVIYPSKLETCNGRLFMLLNFKMAPKEMPAMIFAYWYNGGIVSMSHQSLQ